MTIANCDDPMEILDEAEWETLCDYLEGRLTNEEDEHFEDRLERDGAFRQRMRPFINSCYKSDVVLPTEIEAGMRLAQRGIIKAPSVAPKPKKRRKVEKRRVKMWKAKWGHVQ